MSNDTPPHIAESDVEEEIFYSDEEEFTRYPRIVKLHPKINKNDSFEKEISGEEERDEINRKIINDILLNKNHQSDQILKFEKEMVKSDKIDLATYKYSNYKKNKENS